MALRKASIDAVGMVGPSVVFLFSTQRKRDYALGRSWQMVFNRLLRHGCGTLFLLDSEDLPSQMLVSFHMTMVPKESPYSKMDIFVVPGWGFYVFLMATILSLILTHVILAFHRSCVSPGPSPEEENMLREKG